MKKIEERYVGLLTEIYPQTGVGRYYLRTQVDGYYLRTQVGVNYLQTPVDR